MVKSILKRHSTDSVASSCSQSSSSSAPDESPKLKRVSFDGAEPTRVFEADEWDRSPAEVTLSLTYKDVVELRELDVCLVRTGPLMMERTPSRRPTRQRTPTPPSTQRPASPNRACPVLESSPTDQMLDESITHSPTLDRPRLSPTYQYQLFSPQSLPPLLEDTCVTSGILSLDPRAPSHVVSSFDSYFTFHPDPPSHSPPGLPLRAPRLSGVPSPALMPPSPLKLSPSTPPHSPSPKTREFPLIREVRSHTVVTPKHFPLPALSRPDNPALEPAKGVLSPPSYDNATSPDLGSDDVPPPRYGVSLMGWGLRRNSNANRKRGFGLVRKGSASA